MTRRVVLILSAALMVCTTPVFGVETLQITSIDPSQFPEIRVDVEVLDDGEPISGWDVDSFCVSQDDVRIGGFQVIWLEDSASYTLDVFIPLLDSLSVQPKSRLHDVIVCKRIIPEDCILCDTSQYIVGRRIPALSEWGVIVLLVLLLYLGAFYIWRRRILPASIE